MLASTLTCGLVHYLLSAACTAAVQVFDPNEIIIDNLVEDF